MGFIGQNLVKNLSKNYNISIIDNLSSSAISKKTLFEKKKVKIHYIDLSNYSKILNIFKKKKFFCIIHCAAHFANQNSIENPLNDLNSNILGTLNLLEISKKFKIKNFIYLSSSCVYGNNLKLKEIANLRPTETPYAISKFSAELYVQFYAEYHGINSKIIRVFNTYGPGELTHKYRNVIPRFIYQALKNKNLTITGTGFEIRDFTFIDDLVKITKKLMLSKKKFIIINSCTGKKTSIFNLAKLIIKLSNSNSIIKKYRRRKWDKIVYRSGSTEIRNKFLKIEKMTPLKIGLLKTINWYKDVLA